MSTTTTTITNYMHSYRESGMTITTFDTYYMTPLYIHQPFIYLGWGRTHDTRHTGAISGRME